MTEKLLVQRSNEVVRQDVASYKSLFKNTSTVDERNDKYQTLVTKYYSIVTDFFEYGWGRSFHFANRYHGETFEESLQRHESYLALRMGLKSGDKVLDIGCGVGGPLRRIAYLSKAHITGIPENCNFVHGDFMNLPFADNTFDYVYVIEAACHAPDKAKCFAEVFRVLKPGGRFSGYDWCLTDKYDSQNKEHVEIKHLVEEGDGLPELQSTHQLVSDLNKAGFVIEDNFIIPAGDIPWYSPLKGGDSFLSVNNFRATKIGRWLTYNMVSLLEKTRIAAEGSSETLAILEKAASGLVRAGESDILTPYYFFSCT